MCRGWYTQNTHTHTPDPDVELAVNNILLLKFIAGHQIWVAAAQRVVVECQQRRRCDAHKLVLPVGGVDEAKAPFARVRTKTDNEIVIGSLGRQVAKEGGNVVVAFFDHQLPNHIVFILQRAVRVMRIRHGVPQVLFNPVLQFVAVMYAHLGKAVNALQSRLESLVAAALRADYLRFKL